MATVLVVDDDASIRKLVCTILRIEGYDVLSASNGLEAVAVYRSYADNIALVITDIRMPVMDGIQAILRIRETRPGAKVICMTADSADRCPENAGLLQKPFTRDALCAITAQALLS